MDGSTAASSEEPCDQHVVRTASVSALERDPLAHLANELGAGPFALVVLFVSPRADDVAIARMSAGWNGVPTVVGCTTAGEINGRGYVEDEIVAVGFPAELFDAETLIIPDVDLISPEDILARTALLKRRLAVRRCKWSTEFAMLLVDGLSRREDAVATAVSAGLGSVPLFGGSAGDGIRFERALVFADGRAWENAAILTVVRSACRAQVFNLDHFRPTEKRMIVTEADAPRRIVHRLNDEPAAQEYARLLGKDPAQLSSFTFAAHPVVVRIGGRHHVRAIQRIDENGDLVFFSAVDEGLVMSLAEPLDIVAHLDQAFSAMAEGGVAPDSILTFDCILRRLEAQQKQLSQQMSRLLRKHRAVGFSTYGEQMNAMHVSQTMTGVALYRP